MIEFKKIRYKNLLSVGNSFIEIDLQESPTTLIIGKNGSGKSTMLDALVFVLFGKPFRDVNKPLLVNSINNSDCLVECDFVIGETVYMVRRGIKPTVFEVWKDGVMQKQDASTGDYQKVLEKNILQMNYKSFTQIVILGSSFFVPFMQLKTGDRRTIIEDLLNITIFSSMNTVVKSHVSANKESVRNIETDAKIVNEKLKMQRKYIDSLSEAVQDIIDAKRHGIEGSNEKVLEKLSEIQKHNDAISLLNEKIADKASVEAKLKQLLEFDKKFNGSIKKLEKELNFYKKNDECPSCTQTISEEFKETTIGEKLEKLATTEKALEKLGKETSKICLKQEAISDILDEISTLNGEVTTLNSDIAGINRYVRALEAEISELESKNTGEVDKEQEKLEELKKTLLGHKHSREALLYKKKLLELAADMLKDAGIKTKIIKQYLPVINQLINKYLTELNFYVNFTLDENFKETIESRFREKFCYGSFSEGQKMRIDLALLFTWVEVARQKNSINTNLLFLDEVFDSSLDDDGTDDFLKLMKNFGANKNVFVISHKTDQMVDKFDNTIGFELRNNFTRLIET